MDEFEARRFSVQEWDSLVDAMGKRIAEMMPRLHGRTAPEVEACVRAGLEELAGHPTYDFHRRAEMDQDSIFQLQKERSDG